MNLNLYVWHNVLSDYTDGVIFALSDSEENARTMILNEYNDNETIKDAIKDAPSIYNSPVCFAISGGS